MWCNRTELNQFLCPMLYILHIRIDSFSCCLIQELDRNYAPRYCTCRMWLEIWVNVFACLNNGWVCDVTHSRPSARPVALSNHPFFMMFDNGSDKESTQVAVSASQFSKLMEGIEVSHRDMDTKLLWFEEEIRQGQEEVVSRALNAHATRSPTYLGDVTMRNRSGSKTRLIRPCHKWKVNCPGSKPVPPPPRALLSSEQSRPSRNVGPCSRSARSWSSWLIVWSMGAGCK